MPTEKLEQAKVENKQLGCEVAAMGGRMEHAQKETKALKAQLQAQAWRADAQKSEIDEQTQRQSDTAQLIERVRADHLARAPRAALRCRSALTAPRPPAAQGGAQAHLGRSKRSGG